MKTNNQKNLVYEILKRVRETGTIAKGILETTRAVEKGTAKLVIIAKDVKPKNLISHLPNLCRCKNTPFIWATSKEKLGKVIGLEIPCSSCAVVNVGESQDLIAKLEKSKIQKKEKLKGVAYIGREPINLLSIDRVEKQIWFQEKFAKPILKGVIKGTLRLGKRIPAKMILPVFISGIQKKLVNIEIKTIIWLKYNEIQKYSGIIKGLSFENFDGLDTEMKKIYPTLKKEDWFTFYGFNLSKK